MPGNDLSACNRHDIFRNFTHQPSQHLWLSMGTLLWPEIFNFSQPKEMALLFPGFLGSFKAPGPRPLIHGSRLTPRRSGVSLQPPYNLCTLDHEGQFVTQSNRLRWTKSPAKRAWTAKQNCPLQFHHLEKTYSIHLYDSMPTIVNCNDPQNRKGSGPRQPQRGFRPRTCPYQQNPAKANRNHHAIPVFKACPTVGKIIGWRLHSTSAAGTLKVTPLRSRRKTTERLPHFNYTRQCVLGCDCMLTRHEISMVTLLHFPSSWTGDVCAGQWSIGKDEARIIPG